MHRTKFDYWTIFMREVFEDLFKRKTIPDKMNESTILDRKRL